MSKSAVLVDIGRCIGCETCTAACTTNRGLPVEDDRVLWTNIKGFELGQFPAVQAFFTKRQCMHCEHPACVSACPVGALQKTTNGPVVYDAGKCIGCRYCMTACPFNVPRYDWHKAVPFIEKCNFCADRQAAGLSPACAESCPSGALLFGEREELLDIAKTRIYQNPDRYVHHVYGEQEVGGTSWLYISPVPFEQVGFKDVGTAPYSQLTWPFLSAVPVVLVVAPALLGGLYAFTKRREAIAQAEMQEGREIQHE